MLRPFFGNTQPIGEVLAIDVGTASVSGAVAALLDDGSYQVSLLQEPFDLLDFAHKDEEGKRVTHVVCQNITKIMAHAQDIASPIRTVRIALASPFFNERILSRQFDRAHSQTPIEEQELQTLLKTWEESIQSTSREPSILTVCNRTILETKVNGYPVPDARGYRGKHLAFTARFLLLAHFFHQTLQEMKDTFFPAGTLSCYSDARILCKALAAQFSPRENILVVDIGGEITAPFVCRGDETILYLPFIPFGMRTLERRLAASLRSSMREAESVLRRHTAGTLEEAIGRRTKRGLEVALTDWWHHLAKSLTGTLPHDALSRIIVTGGGADLPLFADMIKAHYQELARDRALPPCGRLVIPEERFHPTHVMRGGGDDVLASLILYA